MNAKVLIGALIGGVVAFLAGFVLYAQLFGGFFEANMGSATGVWKSEADMDFLWLVIGNLVWGLLLSWLFYSHMNVRSFMSGLTSGAMVGLLVSLASNAIGYGTTNIYTLTAVLVDPLVMAIMLGVTGGVIGWYFGRSKA